MSWVKVDPGERGQIRVFEMSDDLRMEVDHSGTYERLERALGDVPLSSDDVQTVTRRYLGEMSVTEFLAEAYDVAPNTLPDGLNETKGDLVVIRSAAFPADGAMLSLNSDLTFLGFFAEQQAAPPSRAALDALRQEEEEVDLAPTGGKAPTPPRARGSIMVLAAVLAALIAAAIVFFRTVSA